MKPARLIAALLLAWTLTVGSSVCDGFGGALVRMPTQTVTSTGPTYSVQTGLALEVDTRWFDAGGYRPVLLRVSTATAVGNPRTVEVTLSLAESSGRGLSGEPGLVVTGSVTLPEGATEAEATLLCPGVSEWRFAWWDVTVDSQTDPRLSVPRGGAIPIATNPQPVSLRKLNPQAAGANPPSRARDGDVKFFRRLSGPTLNDVVAPFQADWLAYTGADIVAVDLSELKTLAQSSPIELTALRQWILAGGTLWVERSGASKARFDTIDDLLAIKAWRFQAIDSERAEEPQAPGPTSTPTAEEAETAIQVDPSIKTTDGKETPNLGRTRTVHDIEGHPGWGHALLSEEAKGAAEVTKQLQDGEPSNAVQRLRAGTTDTSGWYAQRDVGFGRVLAFRRTALETPIALALGGAREATQQWTQRSWGPRHGFLPTEPSPAFGNLLIPGVGVAPVNEFQILITLFVLAIGPLNYWLLWRRQQLQLLVLTTPLCALAVTLGLFAYSAVADGFDVKARIRGLTLLDQKTQEAATWSRISHYAAMSPEQLPSLPDDTVIYPIRPVWESAIAAAPASRKIEWNQDQATLVSGWIPSRTTVQHLAIRCRETSAKLVIRGKSDGGEVSNQLGAKIDVLLVCDREGAWGRANEIDAGSTATLTAVTRSEALKDFRLVAIANQPEFPVGAGKAVEQTLERLGNSRGMRRLQRNLSLASLTDNLLNQQIGTFSGLSGGRGLDVPPRTYLAVTSQAVETPLGWDTVQEIGSFHVIVGRY